jgi:hypothetical protein
MANGTVILDFGQAPGIQCRMMLLHGLNVSNKPAEPTFKKNESTSSQTPVTTDQPPL